jgi:CubicO group peptidase (beta-lactamase class C family)
LNFEGIAMGKWTSLIAAAALCLPLAVQAQPAPLSPADSDPVKMGWMQGSPPPEDRLVRFEDGSFRQFPLIRWAFANYRELFPTARISRGKGPISILPVALRPDLANLTFVPKGKTQPVNWVEAFDGLYADAILVLHRGKIVFEKYNGVMNRDQPHILFSITKSVVGTLTETLIAEGKIDETRTVAHYLPELASSGFGDATVRQLLDMTTSLDYNEDAADADVKMTQFGYASGLSPLPPGYNGPRTTFDLLKTVKKVDAHGQRFDYQSVDTEVLGFIIARVTGQRVDRVIEQRIWSRLGAENDGHIVVDKAGSPRSTGGLSTTLRDLARFGEMIRLGGRFNGRQIVPASVVAKIRAGASQKDFAGAIWDYSTRRGFSYKSQWWMTHNANGAFMGIGLHGQALYIDPVAEMVVVRFTSGPYGSTVDFDYITLPAFAALAEHLMKPAPPRAKPSTR